MDNFCFSRFYRGLSTHIFCLVLRKMTKMVVSWVENPKIEAIIRLSMPRTDLTTIFDHTDGLGLFFKLLFLIYNCLSFLQEGTTSELCAFGSGHDRP